MTGNVLNYFAGGNTAKGHYSLFHSNLSNLERLYILKGGPGTGKSHFIKKIGKEWQKRGYSLEYIYCSSDKDSLDGAIIRELNVGIVDGTNPHVIEPQFPGAVDEYVNLGVAWDSEKLRKNKEEIISLTNQVSYLFQAAYDSFGDAFVFYEKQRENVRRYLNSEKLKRLTETLVDELFDEKLNTKTAVVKHRFHGANTPTGYVSFLHELTEPLRKRYVLTGRPGTGKSLVLKRLLLEAEIRGFHVEAYHCGFVPENIDLLIIRDLDLAVIDHKQPHKLRKIRDTDKVIEMEKEVLDSKLIHEDEELTEAYEKHMQEAFSSLQKVKILRGKLENYYTQAMDFQMTTKIREDVQREIEKIAAEQ